MNPAAPTGVGGDRAVPIGASAHVRAATRRSPQTPLLLALATVLAALPPLWPLVALGVLVAAAAVLVSPPVGLYLLPFSVPYQALVGFRIGGMNITATEGLVLLTLVSWWGAVLTKRATGPPRDRLLPPLVFFVGLLAVTVVRSKQHELAAKELLKWIELLAAFLLAVSLLQSAARRRLVVACLLLAAVSQALLGFYQVLFRVGPGHFMVGSLFMRAYGSFEQPNPFGGYVGLIFPVALSLALWSHAHRWRHWLWLSTALLGGAALLTGSRGAWFGLAVGTLVVLLVGSRSARHALVVTSIVLAALLAVAPPLLPAELTGRVLVAAAAVVDAGSLTTVQVTPENWAVMERLSQWYAGWRMFRDNWWLGVGIGNYNAYYDDYRLPQWPMALGHAHNLYLTLAAEAGFFAIVGLTIVLVLVARLCRVGMRESPDASTRALSLGLAGGLAAFAAHNLFDVLLVHGMGVLIGVYLGLLSTANYGLHPLRHLVGHAAGLRLPTKAVGGAMYAGS